MLTNKTDKCDGGEVTTWWRCVDDVEPGVESATYRSGTGVQRQRAIGNIADAEPSGDETRPTQLTTRCKRESHGDYLCHPAGAAPACH